MAAAKKPDSKPGYWYNPYLGAGKAFSREYATTRLRPAKKKMVAGYT